MKRCPTCTRVYDGDNLRFCLDDGTPLVDKPAETPPPETLVLPSSENQPTLTQPFQAPPPPRTEPAYATTINRKPSRWPWVIGAILIVLLIGGAAVGGWMLFHKQPLVWHLVLEVDPAAPDRRAAITQTIAVIENRLDAIGIRNFEVTPEGNPTGGRIRISLPALPDPERVKQLLTTAGKLELVHVITPPSPAPTQTYMTKEEAIASLNTSGSIPSNRRVLPYAERAEPSSRKWVVVESPAIINGSDLRNAEAVTDVGRKGNYQITFQLKPDGADKFGSWTGAHINEYIGVVLNDEVKSIAYIRSQIYDSAEITGDFTKQQAEDLALVLKAGRLPVSVKLIEERTGK